MVDMSVNGPLEEREYYLDKHRLDQSHYHDIARSITQHVLEASPRRVSEIRLMGTLPLLRGVDGEALETLREVGFTVADEQLDGRVASSEAVIKAVLSLYAPGLHHAHFFDSDGYGIAARYDDTLQHYWLPEATSREVREELDSKTSAAFVSKDEFAERIEQRRPESIDS